VPQSHASTEAHGQFIAHSMISRARRRVDIWASMSLNLVCANDRLAGRPGASWGSRTRISSRLKPAGLQNAMTASLATTDGS
jgi:hypothetical protein